MGAGSPSLEARMNRRTGSVVAMLIIATLPTVAQSLNVPTKGIPRTKLRPFKRMPTGFEPEKSSSMLSALIGVHRRLRGFQVGGTS